MTILKCSAVKCMYNENELCSRGDIEITGANARHAEDTTCGSFRDRNSSGSAMNCSAQHCGCEKINIDCKAQECTYNDHCKCTASAINVSGCHATECCDTKCDTFSCKC